LEESKPPIPADCAHLHWLLATPFRYAPYPTGSRFRRAGQREGAFYTSEALHTAFAEAAFARLLFFANAPEAAIPQRPIELTAIRVSCATDMGLDITAARDSSQMAGLSDPIDYTRCQELADAARAHGFDAIRYRSVRDPKGGANVCIISPRAFAQTAPVETQTWHLLMTTKSIRVWPGVPGGDAFEFDANHFASDPRVRAA
jgi:hypothetical protein